MKQELKVGIRVLPHGNVPDRVWIVLDKISFGLTQDLYIGIWYVPPSMSSWLSHISSGHALLEVEIVMSSISFYDR